MMEEIKIVDNNHIWYKGRQFVSLNRFIELKTNQLNEMEILEQEIDRLNKENESYRNLLGIGGQIVKWKHVKHAHTSLAPNLSVT